MTKNCSKTSVSVEENKKISDTKESGTALKSTLTLGAKLTQSENKDYEMSLTELENQNSNSDTPKCKSAVEINIAKSVCAICFEDVDD